MAAITECNMPDSLPKPVLVNPAVWVGFSEFSTFKIKHSVFQVLYMKLFLILGILWTIETVHFFVHNHYNEPCQTSMYIKIAFRVLDSCNILRGFFFLIIFVCKRNVWIKIQRFFFLKFRSPPTLELVERRSFNQGMMNRDREATTTSDDVSFYQ